MNGNLPPWDTSRWLRKKNAAETSKLVGYAWWIRVSLSSLCWLLKGNSVLRHRIAWLMMLIQSKHSTSHALMNLRILACVYCVASSYWCEHLRRKHVMRQAEVAGRVPLHHPHMHCWIGEFLVDLGRNFPKFNTGRSPPPPNKLSGPEGTTEQRRCSERVSGMNGRLAKVTARTVYANRRRIFSGPLSRGSMTIKR